MTQKPTYIGSEYFRNEEAHLKLIDGILDEFAQPRGLTIERNYQGTANRVILVPDTGDGLERKLEVTPRRERKEFSGYNLFAYAELKEEKKGKREKRFTKEKDVLNGELNRLYETMINWAEEDCE